MSKPQPDLALLRPRSYISRGPRPEDTLLVVEVADTSLIYDRRVKLALYAEASIPEYWIVDTEAECVEVHREPIGAAYRVVGRVDRTGSVSPVAFADARLAVAELFA
jgi:Uma2 family endonuclease